MSVMSATETKKSDQLTTFDRCDKCGAQAYVKVILHSSNALSFCGHHWTGVEAGIAPYIAESPIDERWKLTWDRHVGTENS